jgi:hypothetical protein
MFTTAIITQKDRLRATFTEEDIQNMQTKHKLFERKYHSDEGFKCLVQATKQHKSFDDTWSWLYQQYPLLVAFCGGIGSTFPGTSTVESDFSIVGWEKDDYRTALSNLSLEGILHAKQREEIIKIQAILSHLNVKIKRIP